MSLLWNGQDKAPHPEPGTLNDNLFLPASPDRASLFTLHPRGHSHPAVCKNKLLHTGHNLGAWGCRWCWDPSRPPSHS